MAVEVVVAVVLVAVVVVVHRGSSSGSDSGTVTRVVPSTGISWRKLRRKSAKAQIRVATVTTSYRKFWHKPSVLVSCFQNVDHRDFQQTRASCLKSAQVRADGILYRCMWIIWQIVID